MLNLDVPGLLAANCQFHRLLVNGVPVEYQKDGDSRGDLVRLIDWNSPSPQPPPAMRGSDLNEWLAINHFAIKGPKHPRRPDIILLINGLPLVLLELKNPADENADIWKAFDQIQTYKEQIPDVFQYNELLVISDGSEAWLGSVSSDAEHFMQWRTIDGIRLDPLGQFNELEKLIRGLLSPATLLDYARIFVLFEDDGDLVWHTQGSGKSITMTCFAARVMQEAAMENPTIVVITDRNDLDAQLFGVFSLGQDLLREQPVQAKTRQDLRAKLAIRQIINSAVVSKDVVNIFEAVDLDKPNIGILDDDFLADVRNLAVDLLDRLLDGEEV